MKILVACEESQAVTIELRKLGHEARHKEWQKRGLMAPLQPQETPEYSFSDLQMNLYNTIYL